MFYVGVLLFLILKLKTAYIYSMMQLDDGMGSNCGTRKVSYSGLQDGNHTFEVCTNGPQGIGCALHNWTVGKEPFPYPF